MRSLCTLALCVTLFSPASAADSDSLRWYAGDTHVHTALHAVSTIEQRVQEGINGGLDWVAITRHKRSGAFWKAHEVDAAFDRHAAQTAPLLGMEWDEPPDLGSEDIIILGVNRHSPIPDDNLQSVIDWTNREGGVFIFAHPSPFVFDNIRKWHGYIAFEGYSGAGRWNAACEPGAVWDALLTEGERMFIVGASDNHNEQYLGERIVKTEVLARSNRPDDIIEGIRAGRVFVSEQGQARLDFTIEDRRMGETVSVDGDSLNARLSIIADAPITRIRLIGNGKEVWSATPNTVTYDRQIRMPVTPTMRYIRVIIETGATRTMGNPIFLEQEGEIRKASVYVSPPHPLADWQARVQGRRPLLPEIQAALRIQLADPDPETRMNAAYGMIEFDAPNTTDALFTLATDSIPAVRAYAARLLAGRSTSQDLPKLKPLLRDSAPEVRLWAVHAIDRIASPESRSLLIEALNDAASWVQFAALEGLVDMAARDATLFDELDRLVVQGNVNAAGPFNWAPPNRKNAMIALLRNKFENDHSSALYLALERLGASPAETYQIAMKKVRTPPRIDGKLDDDVWKNNPASLSLMRDDISVIDGKAAQTFVAYDDKALYLAFQCPHEQIPASAQNIEYVMIGFDTNHNGGIDYTFEIDRNGQVFGEKDGITAWNKPVQVQSASTSALWIVEIAIPYTSIEWTGPVNGATWGFNAGYGVRGQNTRLSSWAPTLGQPSNASRYGDMVFGE